MPPTIRRRALSWAVEQSVAEHRTLTLVHSIHVGSPAFMDAAIVYQQDAETRLRAEGQQVLDDAVAEVERIAPGVEVEQVLRVMDPRAVLLELSRDAAMVVLGSRGRGQLRTLLLGSVGTALVRHAQCPVVVHRPGNPGLVRNGILVGVDASPESRIVLEFAYREASLRDLPLTLLHCGLDAHADAMGAYLVAESIVDPEAERLALAEAIAGMAEKYPEVRTTTEIVTWAPAGSAAACRGADEPDRRRCPRPRPHEPPALRLGGDLGGGARDLRGRRRPLRLSRVACPQPSRHPSPRCRDDDRSHQRNCGTPQSRRNARSGASAPRRSRSPGPDRTRHGP